MGWSFSKNQRFIFPKANHERLPVFFEKTYAWTAHIENQWFNLPVTVPPWARWFKVFNQVWFPLDPSISEFTDLLGVEALPLLSVELLKKLEDKNRINKIDECISNIAFILNQIRKYGYLKINRQVEEVILVLVVLIDLLQKHLLCILVWDVLNHDRGPLVLLIDDVVQAELELVAILGILSLPGLARGLFALWSQRLLLLLRLQNSLFESLGNDLCELGVVDLFNLFESLGFLWLKLLLIILSLGRVFVPTLKVVNCLLKLGVVCWLVYLGLGRLVEVHWLLLLVVSHLILMKSGMLLHQVLLVIHHILDHYELILILGIVVEE